MKKFVYEVKVDWASQDDQGCDTTLYRSHEKALKRFNAEKIQALQDYGFNDDGTHDDNGYHIDHGKDYWCVFYDGFYNQSHCEITITKKEVF